jgi:hypothetical protein
VLRYLYGFDYTKAVDLPLMVFTAQVYALADKYDIPALKILATTKFEALATDSWNTTDFPHSIKVMYESTPSDDRGLRDVALRLAAENSHALFEDNEEFHAMIGEVAEFGKDLAHALSDCVKVQPVIKRYKCPGCAGIWQTTERVYSGRNFHCQWCGRRYSDWPSHLLN